MDKLGRRIEGLNTDYQTLVNTRTRGLERPLDKIDNISLSKAKKDEIETKSLSSKPFPLIEITKNDDLPADTEIIIKQAEEKIKKPSERKIHQSVTSIETNKKINQNQNVIGNIFSYILVGIISFVALIIVLDTFKSPLSEIFPKLEYFLASLYETLKDIELFIIDLI